MANTSTNAYRGFKSTTFILVMMGFWTGTALLVAELITAQIWETSVLGLITLYIGRAAISSAAEAYIANKSGSQSSAPGMPG